jgi:prepilin-type processing-associated H-X9-DG protein
LIEKKLAAVDDPVSWVACGDGQYSDYLSPGLLAYPDLCNAECGNCACSSWIADPACSPNIQSGCPEVWACFEQNHTSPTMLKDKQLMKKGMRHLGGSNIGFLDGHASWWNADKFLDTWAEKAKEQGGWPTAMGLYAWGPYSWCSSSATSGDAFSVAFPEEPTLR